MAHKTLPKGTLLDLTGPNGKTVRVEVTDRGPYIQGRTIDTSARVARELGFSEQGLANYTAAVVKYGDNKYSVFGPVSG